MRPLRQTELEAAILSSIKNINLKEVRAMLKVSQVRGLIYINPDGIVTLKNIAWKRILFSRELKNSRHALAAYFAFEEQTGQEKMTRILISYLSDPRLGGLGPCKLPKEWNERQRDYPLLSYAANSWFKHYFEAGTVSESLADKVSKFWTTGLDSYYGVWCQALEWPFNHNHDEWSLHHMYRYLEHDSSPLYQLSSWGLAGPVEAMLEGRPHPEHEVDEGQALLCAVRSGRSDVAALLLKRGADIKATTLWAGSILESACVSNGASIVRNQFSQLDFSSIVENVGVSGDTPLHKAVQKMVPGFPELLLAQGATVDAYSSMGATPLLVAVSLADVNLVKLLLDAGANPDGVPHLRSPLHALCSHKRNTGKAVEERTISTIRLLIQAGADPAAPDADGVTPLSLAAMKGHTDIVTELLKHYSKEDINAAGRWGTGDPSTALTAAVIYNAPLDVVKQLVENGATAPPGNYPIPLREVLENSDEADAEVLKYFCEKFPDAIAAHEASGESMVYTALTSWPGPSRKVIEYLLQLSSKRGDTNVLGSFEKYEESALQAAARCGLVELVLHHARGDDVPWGKVWQDIRRPSPFREFNPAGVELFLSRKPEFDSMGHLLKTLFKVLGGSCSDQSEEVALFYLEKLEKKGGPPLRQYKGKDGDTLLHRACENADSGLVARLLEDHHAYPNEQNDTGVTPFMRCFECFPNKNMSQGTVKKLLERGAKVTTQDANGRTALSYATDNVEWENSGRELEAIQMLVESEGARDVINLSDDKGLRPIDYACLNNMYGVTRILIDAGAELRIKDDNGQELLPRIRLIGTSSGGRYPLLEELIQMGADIHATDSTGENLLYNAASGGDPQLLRMLMVKYKLDPTVPLTKCKDRFYLPFLDACRYNATNAYTMLKYATPEQRDLLIHGKSIDGNGDTALHVFTKNFNLPVVRWLLDAGADPNAVDAKGRTPLFFANRRGTGLSIVEGADGEALTCGYYLLKAGANPRFRNPVTGKTVYEYILEDNWYDLKEAALDMLVRHGARDSDDD
ncbi:Tankyrase-2 [Dactylellina cionopaga]|nr:Tankyrase-2 [Dactylellina cionopaga]